jgi:hypothetical protein
MDKLLLALRLGSKRDVVEARQRARQVAGLLGFDSRDQAALAAGVFSLGCQAYRNRAGTSLLFQVQNRALRVFLGSRNGAVNGLSQIEMSLPDQSFFAEEDIRWMVKELSRRPPPTVFEELEKVNQDLVQALLHDGRQRRTMTRPATGKTA